MMLKKDRRHSISGLFNFNSKQTHHQASYSRLTKYLTAFKIMSSSEVLKWPLHFVLKYLINEYSFLDPIE